MGCGVSTAAAKFATWSTSIHAFIGGNACGSSVHFRTSPEGISRMSTATPFAHIQPSRVQNRRSTLSEDSTPREGLVNSRGHINREYMVLFRPAK